MTAEGATLYVDIYHSPPTCVQPKRLIGSYLSTSSNIRQHRSSQSYHRSSQSIQKEDEFSDISGIIEDSARARRGSVNDLKVHSIYSRHCARRRIGHEEKRFRVSVTLPNELYHLPTATDFDLCDNYDKLNVILLDTIH